MIPRALRECAQWVVWKTFIKRQGKKVKKVKMPYDPKTGKPAQVNNPLTWGTYSEACRAAYRYDGLGFVFTADDPFVGIDIDHCIDDDGRIREDAQELVDRFESYCEKSPSGTGLHIIITADGLKDGRRGIRTDDIEVYAQDRYFTVTGNAILDVPIQNGQAVLDELVSRIAPAVKQEKKPAGRKKAEPAVLKAAMKSCWKPCSSRRTAVSCRPCITAKTPGQATGAGTISISAGTSISATTMIWPRPTVSSGHREGCATNGMKSIGVTVRHTASGHWPAAITRGECFGFVFLDCDDAVPDPGHPAAGSRMPGPGSAQTLKLERRNDLWVMKKYRNYMKRNCWLWASARMKPRKS